MTRFLEKLGLSEASFFHSPLVGPGLSEISFSLSLADDVLSEVSVLLSLLEQHDACGFSFPLSLLAFPGLGQVSFLLSLHQRSLGV